MMAEPALHKQVGKQSGGLAEVPATKERRPVKLSQRSCHGWRGACECVKYGPNVAQFGCF
jgi:hypothetical protein